MRSTSFCLILSISVILLVDLSSATDTTAVPVVGKAMKLLKQSLADYGTVAPAHLANVHAYITQQVGGGVGSSAGGGPSAKCQTVMMDLYSNGCADALSKLDGPGSGSGAAGAPGGFAPSPAAFDTICSTKCYDNTLTFMNECLSSVDMHVDKQKQEMAVALIELMCSPGPHGKRCAEYIGSGMNCSMYSDASSCSAAPARCWWDKASSVCTPASTVLCEPCMQKFMRLITQSVPLMAGMMSKASEVACYRAPNGTFCMDMFQDAIQSSGIPVFGGGGGGAGGGGGSGGGMLPPMNPPQPGPEFSRQMVKGICTDVNRYVCLSKLGAGTASMAEDMANTSLTFCLQFSDSTNDRQKCVDEWRKTSYEAWGLPEFMNIACVSPTPGHHCTVAMVDPDEGERSCLEKATTNTSRTGTCSPSCNSLAKHWVDKLGCCVGFRRDFDSKVLPATFAEKMPPGISKSDAQGITPTHAAPDVPHNPLSPLKTCTSVSKVDFDQKCPIVFTSPVSRVLVLKLRWDGLSADPKLFKEVNASLKEDIATSIGISESDFFEFRVSKDDRLQLSTSASAKKNEQEHVRGFALEEDSATTAATRVDLSFRTTSAALSNGFAETFDAALGADTIGLKHTQELLVEQCPSCVQGDEGSLVDRRASGKAKYPMAPSANLTGTPTSSSSPLTGVFVVAVLLVAGGGIAIVALSNRNRRRVVRSAADDEAEEEEATNRHHQQDEVHAGANDVVVGVVVSSAPTGNSCAINVDDSNHQDTHPLHHSNE